MEEFQQAAVLLSIFNWFIIGNEIIMKNLEMI